LFILLRQNGTLLHILGKLKEFLVNLDKDVIALKNLKFIGVIYGERT